MKNESMVCGSRTMLSSLLPDGRAFGECLLLVQLRHWPELDSQIGEPCLMQSESCSEVGESSCSFGVQVSSERAMARGNVIYSRCSGVETYSVQRLHCAPRTCCVCSAVRTSGMGSKAYTFSNGK